MLELKGLIYQLLLVNSLFICLTVFTLGVPIISETKVNNETPIISDTDLNDCSNNPCNCCSDKLLAMAEEYSKKNGDNTDCEGFLKNLFCTLACNEESSDIGSISGLIMIISVCGNGCAEITSKCPSLSRSDNSLSVPKEQAPLESESEKGDISVSRMVGVRDKTNFNKQTIGSNGFNSLTENDKSECSNISVPEMQTSKSNPYSLAFINASSDSKVCLNPSGGFQILSKNEIRKLETRESVPQTTPGVIDTTTKPPDISSISNATPAPGTTDQTSNSNVTPLTNAAPLTIEDLKCGFCFSKCCCWPVWSGAFVSFAAYLVMAFIAIYWQSALFSLGLRSTHFWKGGGYWLLGSAILGITVGMIVGGLVSNCFAGALVLGGSLTNLFMCVLLVGRLGAALGGLGGIGTGATIGLMAHSGTISWSVGLILGLLLGLVVGFSPIARSLKMNDRYIRRGIRQREMRRRSRLSESGHSEVSEASGTDRVKS